MHRNKRRAAKKILLAAAVLVMVLAVAACAKEGKVSTNSREMKALFEEKDKVVIDCFGDSITWGLYESYERQSLIEEGKITPSLDDGGQYSDTFGIYVSSTAQSDPTYPQALENKLNKELAADGDDTRVEVYNDGICGDWLVEDNYKRITCDPDVVVMLYSGNNYYYDHEVSNYMEKNIEALREQGCIVYLANYVIYPDRGLVIFFRKANQHIKQVSQSTDTPLIDTNEMMQNGGYDLDDLFSPDRIHLSQKGYELMGTLIAEAIYNDIRQAEE